ncbi:transcriptional regulator [Prochlorococcus marinus]|uniref:Transcriptional regulator n=1 Tax=Prochlorococcus marinus XMU1408 TaxID=2213228 RepID=A0A318R440_PROMR|nr:transcriptional regulator [Prochlorococcus marinus]MBW3041814.1 transcriptional regulator [Prochlorococcus marinus str. XMU1408]PYE02954.1 transcriptional regulator [Prochlorococcus marinus XMU1408]
MIKNKCLVCGSFDFRADRALSGRLICISCGNPYGVRKFARNKSNKKYSSPKNIKKLLIILLLIIVFIFVIV